MTSNAWTQPDVALVALAGSLVPGRALDVGCGGGHDSIWLAEEGWTVTALDCSRHVIQRLRKLASTKRVAVTAVQADVTAGVPASFDLVSVCYMHLPASDRARMLANAAGAVAPGGRLLYRGFDASIGEAPFDRGLLPSGDAVVAELGNRLTIDKTQVADEYFPYMKKEMTLLTVQARRST